MNKEKTDYIQSVLHTLNTVIVMVSKGTAWIEDDNEKVRLTGVTDLDVKNAGILQLMFNKPPDKDRFGDVQKALDHFGWKLKVTENKKEVTFNGEDRFILVQIAWSMGSMTSKQYAEIYRKAVINREKIYF